MSYRKKITALLYICFCACNVYSQQRFIGGITAGWQSNYLRLRQSDLGTGSAASFHAGVVADYTITSRLSIHAQAGVQLINERQVEGSYKQRLIYPGIRIGFTEYIPVGGGALFTTAALTAAYGMGNEYTPGNAQPVFQQEGYNPFRAGYAIEIGYIIRTGLFINAGLSGGINNYYRSVSGNAYYEVGFPSISIGYLLKYDKRLVLPRRSKK